MVSQMACKYTVRTMKRRWLVYSFQNTLDLAAIAAWVLFKEINDTKITRRYFLQNLAEKLEMPFMRRTTMQVRMWKKRISTINNQQDTAKSRNIVKKPLCWQMAQMQKISEWKMYCKHRARVHKAVGLADDNKLGYCVFLLQ